MHNPFFSLLGIEQTLYTNAVNDSEDMTYLASNALIEFTVQSLLNTKAPMLDRLFNVLGEGIILEDTHYGDMFSSASGPSQELKVAIAGGAYRSLFNNELPRDIDLFLFCSMDSFVGAGLGLVKQFTLPSNQSDSVREIATILDLCPTLNPNIKLNVSVVRYHFSQSNTYSKINSLHKLLFTFDNAASAIGAAFSLIQTSDGYSKQNCIFYSDVEVQESTLAKYSIYNKKLLPNELGSQSMKSTTLSRFYKYTHDYNFTCDPASLRWFNTILSKTLVES